MEIVAGRDIEVTKLHGDRTAVSVLVPTLQADGTVTWDSSGTSPGVGNGSISSYYIRHGNLVTVSFELSAGSTTTAGTGTYTVSLPFANTAAVGFVGSAYYQDASTGKNSDGVCVVTSGQTFVSWSIGDADWTATSPAAPANGDVVGFTITYPWV